MKTRLDGVPLEMRCCSLRTQNYGSLRIEEDVKRANAGPYSPDTNEDTGTGGLLTDLLPVCPRLSCINVPKRSFLITHCGSPRLAEEETIVTIMWEIAVAAHNRPGSLVSPTKIIS